MPFYTSDRPGNNVRGIRADVYERGRVFEKFLKIVLLSHGWADDADDAFEDGSYKRIVEFICMPEYSVHDVRDEETHEQKKVWVEILDDDETKELVRSEYSLRVLVWLKTYEALVVKLNKDMHEADQKMYSKHVKQLNTYNEYINILQYLYSFIWTGKPEPNEIQFLDPVGNGILDEHWRLAKVEYERRLEETVEKFEKKMEDMLHEEDHMGYDHPSYDCYGKIVDYLEKHDHDEVKKRACRARVLVMLRVNDDEQARLKESSDYWDDAAASQNLLFVMYKDVLEALYYYLRTGTPRPDRFDNNFRLDEAMIDPKDMRASETEYSRRAAKAEEEDRADEASDERYFGPEETAKRFEETLQNILFEVETDHDSLKSWKSIRRYLDYLNPNEDVKRALRIRVLVIREELEANHVEMNGLHEYVYDPLVVDDYQLFDPFLQGVYDYLRTGATHTKKSLNALFQEDDVEIDPEDMRDAQSEFDRRLRERAAKEEEEERLYNAARKQDKRKRRPARDGGLFATEARKARR